MSVRDAKDFLVRETAMQAELEGVPLSKLEKRMMYFVENEEMSEDPVALNDEFEAEHDTDEYEAKISGLLHRAYDRIKKENPDATRQWKQAIRDIGKGDHYLSVLWATPPEGPVQKGRAKGDSLKLLAAGLLVAAFLVAVCFGANLVGKHYGIDWSSGRRGGPPHTQTRMPLWLQRVLIFGLGGSYIYFAVLPFILKKSPLGVGALWSKMFRRGNEGKSAR